MILVNDSVLCCRLHDVFEIRSRESEVLISIRYVPVFMINLKQSIKNTLDIHCCVLISTY
jgi:hypothetical protein